MSRIAKVLLGLFVLVVAISGSLYLTIVRPQIYVQRQIRDFQRLKVLQTGLDRYRTAHGYFPQSLGYLAGSLTDEESRFVDDYIDSWGHRIHYEAVDAGYLLVSLGKNGKVDHDDLYGLRETSAHADVCGSWNAEQVLADTGWHQSCAK